MRLTEPEILEHLLEHGNVLVALDQHGAACRFHVLFRGDVDEAQCLGQREDAIGADWQPRLAQRAREHDQIGDEVGHGGLEVLRS